MMNARSLLVVGAAFGAASAASGQITPTASSAEPGDPYVSPQGGVVYDNAYDGTSTFGSAAQIFEPTFSAYDIWVGDDFSTATGYDSLTLEAVGFCGNGCVDPFLVSDLVGRFYDLLPNDPNAELQLESTGYSFNGIDAWTSDFGDGCLPAGDWYFVYAAENEFGSNGQTYFFQQSGSPGGDNGFQWNPGGAFGFPDNVQSMIDQAGAPTAPNAVITGSEADCSGDPCDLADCNGDGQKNILDFVCFQKIFTEGVPSADCNDDGEMDILDFLCFQGQYHQCAI